MNQADSTDSDVYQALQKDHAVVSSSLEEQHREAKERATELEESVKTLEADRKELADREAELEKAASAIDKAKENTVPVPFAPKKQESAPAPKAPAKPAPQPAPKKTQAPAPTKTYYKNCTAAKNAGAAPVYKGDPGYGKHLDRDGDGIGCEK